MSDTMPSGSAKDTVPPTVEDDQSALIDELMSGPIRPRPKIIVVGDDAVSGFNPAPQVLPPAT